MIQYLYRFLRTRQPQPGAEAMAFEPFTMNPQFIVRGYGTECGMPHPLPERPHYYPIPYSLTGGFGGVQHGTIYSQPLTLRYNSQGQVVGIG